MQDEILSYREMCETEQVQTLQRGMNFRLNPEYSVILMSQRKNAPYSDKILPDGVTIEYQGHDKPKTSSLNPKTVDQPIKTKTGNLTENGKFIQAIEGYGSHKTHELVKIYEKILPGIWSLKGYFDLVEYKKVFDGKRNVFVFTLKLSSEKFTESDNLSDLSHTRLIPSEIKKIVWARDGGKCVLCGDKNNLHFDHDVPFSKGGTSLLPGNIRLLCAKHNLQKSDKIQ